MASTGSWWCCRAATRPWVPPGHHLFEQGAPPPLPKHTTPHKSRHWRFYLRAMETGRWAEFEREQSLGGEGELGCGGCRRWAEDRSELATWGQRKGGHGENWEARARRPWASWAWRSRGRKLGRDAVSSGKENKGAGRAEGKTPWGARGSLFWSRETPARTGRSSGEGVRGWGKGHPGELRAGASSCAPGREQRNSASCGRRGRPRSKAGALGWEQKMHTDGIFIQDGRADGNEATAVRKILSRAAAARISTATGGQIFVPSNRSGWGRPGEGSRGERSGRTAVEIFFLFSFLLFFTENYRYFCVRIFSNAHWIDTLFNYASHFPNLEMEIRGLTTWFSEFSELGQNRVVNSFLTI
jgi:hypothetical protein